VNLCFSGVLPCITLCYTCVSNGENMDDDDDDDDDIQDRDSLTMED